MALQHNIGMHARIPHLTICCLSLAAWYTAHNIHHVRPFGRPRVVLPALALHHACGVTGVSILLPRAPAPASAAASYHTRAQPPPARLPCVHVHVRRPCGHTTRVPNPFRLAYPPYMYTYGGPAAALHYPYPSPPSPFLLQAGLECKPFRIVADSCTSPQQYEGEHTDFILT